MKRCPGRWAWSSVAIVWLLVTFVVLGTIYSIVTPLFEASDELWHYPMVKTLADGHGLPIQDAAHPGPWRQEGSQPPLYYAIGALATFWINTSDVDQVRRLNPHADNGIITEDGNNNIVVHDQAREQWPWSGAALAVHIIRLLSVLMSAGTVYFAYRTGQEIFPRRHWLAFAGAAVVTFTPMFVFISGSVNNDNLGVLMSTAAVWVMARMLRGSRSSQSQIRLALAEGIVLGLAALSKQSTLGLFVLCGLAFLYVAWQRRSLSPIMREGVITVALAVAIAGWWYYRNWMLYKDVTGLNVFLDIVGRRSPPASLIELWGERVGFVQSYWGLFGGVSVPMAEWVYTLLNVVAGLGIVGLAGFLWNEYRNRNYDPDLWARRALTLVWIPAVILPLIFGWTRFTLASQGRLIFSAIGSISAWLMAGWSGWLPMRWGKLVATMICAAMGSITVLAPFVWIGPHYEVHLATTKASTSATADFTPPGAATPVMRLTGYTLHTSSVNPGGTVYLSLYWDSLRAMDRDWSIFVHLQDSADLIAAQRDTYPGLGLLATSDMAPGYRWVDNYAIPISPSAYTPETLRVIVGIYDLADGQRMHLNGGQDSITLGQVALLPNRANSEIPNPIDYQFGYDLKLVGYEIKQRRIERGGSLDLHLLWQGLRPIERDYTLSVQLFDSTSTKLGQTDEPLTAQGQTTKQWSPGKLMDGWWRVTVRPDALAGASTIQLVVYWIDAHGELTRLQLVTPDGRLTDPYLMLTKVQVLP